jgi:hypothetical protein
MLHRGVFVAMSILVTLAWVADPRRDWNTGPFLALWLVLFAFPFMLHWTIRWMNRKADVLREKELAAEIERERQRFQEQPGRAVEKAKRTARLTDDGEIEFDIEGDDDAAAQVRNQGHQGHPTHR